MKIKALIAFAILSASLFGQTTTYTGTIKDLSGAVVTSGNVTFTLTPSVDTTISGTSRFTPMTVNCTINGSGALVANDGVSACVVTQNTALTPTGTSYTICIQPYFTSPGSCFVDYAVTSSKDISTVAPTPQLSPNYPIYSSIFGSAQNVTGIWTFAAAPIFNAPVIFNSTTVGYEVYTGDFLASNLFNIVLNPTVNSTANQFGLQAQMYDLASNTKTFSGQQQAVYGSHSHMGSGTANTMLGGAFEAFNGGAGTTTVVGGVSGNAYCGGVTIAAESTTPQQSPTNNGNCTNLRALWGTTFNLSSGTVANADAIYVGSATNTGGGVITNVRGIDIADQTVGANNWAIKSGLGLVQFGDNLRLDKLFSMGAAANTGVGMWIQPATLTGTTQMGIRVLPASTSTATTFGIGIYGRIDTANAAYTQADNAGLYAANPTKGASSTITRAYGLYIEPITSGSNNLAIKTNGSAVSEFDGGIQAGASGSVITDTREIFQSVHYCGSTGTCANTANLQARMIFGTITLTAGAATLTGIPTSNNVILCTCTDQTTASACKAVQASSTSVTFSGSTTDTLGFQCAAY